jgi:hypothetical protein
LIDSVIHRIAETDQKSEMKCKGEVITQKWQQINEPVKKVYDREKVKYCSMLLGRNV